MFIRMSDDNPLDPMDDPLSQLSVFVAGLGPEPGSVAFMIDDSMFVTEWQDAVRLSTLLLVQASMAAAQSHNLPDAVHNVFLQSLQETWIELQERIDDQKDD